MIKKILQLLIDNRDRKGDFRIVQKGREADVYVYDVIGDDYYGGVSAQSFVEAIGALDVDVIRVRVNSPGGDVFAGVAMGHALRSHKARVEAYIEGQAASAATRLTANADRVYIVAGAFYMIHNAWTVAAGDSNAFSKTSNLLAEVDATIANDYAKKTGQDVKKIRDWMKETTWFNAEDAVAQGFADEILDDSGSSGTQNRWNLSAYDNVPKELLENRGPNEDEINARANALREQNERNLTLLERIAA